MTRGRLFTFLREHGIRVEVASQVSLLYSNHPEVLPNPAEWAPLANLTINLLSSYKLQEVQNAKQVAEILPQIWGRPECAPEVVADSLKAFYALVSCESPDSRPSSALLFFLAKIPASFLEIGGKIMLEDTDEQRNCSGIANHD